MDFVDYYNVLGVAKTATPDEIKKAYRYVTNTHLFHPSLFPKGLTHATCGNPLEPLPPPRRPKLIPILLTERPP